MGKQTDVSLPAGRQAEAMARFGLRPRLEDDVPLARAARDAGVPIRTARRWRARFRQNGVELAVPHGVGRTASRL